MYYYLLRLTTRYLPILFLQATAGGAGQNCGTLDPQTHERMLALGRGGRPAGALRARAGAFNNKTSD